VFKVSRTELLAKQAQLLALAPSTSLAVAVKYLGPVKGETTVAVTQTLTLEKKE
jgi:hypothetical protein